MGRTLRKKRIFKDRDKDMNNDKKRRSRGEGEKDDSARVKEGSIATRMKGKGRRKEGKGGERKTRREKGRRG